MRIVRIYTGEDNASHFEDLDIPLEVTPIGQSMSRPVGVNHAIFRETPVGSLLDFHPAPRRQFVVILEGTVEIECGDGTKRHFSGGDILLADDTAGQGHISRDIHGPRRSIFLPLSDDVDIAEWRA